MNRNGLVLASILSVLCALAATAQTKVLIPYLNFDGTYVYLGPDGKKALEGKFKEAYAFSEGLARVKVGNTSCFIDESGEIAFSDFKVEKGIAVLYRSFDEKGNLIPSTTPTDSTASFRIEGDFHDGRAKVYISDEKSKLFGYGFVDKSGNIAIRDTAVFIENSNCLQDFSEGLSAAKKGPYWGYIDIDGKWIVDPTLVGADQFSDGLARVEYQNAKVWSARYGYIDKTGSCKIKPAFYSASAFHEDRAIVSYSDQTPPVVIDKAGNKLFDLLAMSEFQQQGWLSPSISDKTYFSSGLLGITYQKRDIYSGTRIVIFDLNGNRKSIIDQYNKKIAIIQMATPYIGNLALISINKSLFLLDTNGKIVAGPIPSISKIASTTSGYIVLKSETAIDVLIDPTGKVSPIQ